MRRNVLIMEYQLTKPVSVVALKFERNSSCIGDSM